MSSFTSLPAEVCLELSQYLPVKSQLALTQVNSRVRDTFQSMLWTQCYVITDISLDRKKEQAKYKFPVIALDVLLNPQKYPWFPSKNVQLVHIVRQSNFWNNPRLSGMPLYELCQWIKSFRTNTCYPNIKKVMLTGLRFDLPEYTEPAVADYDLCAVEQSELSPSTFPCVELENYPGYISQEYMTESNYKDLRYDMMTKIFFTHIRNCSFDLSQTKPLFPNVTAITLVECGTESRVMENIIASISDFPNLKSLMMDLILYNADPSIPFSINSEFLLMLKLPDHVECIVRVTHDFFSQSPVGDEYVDIRLPISFPHVVQIITTGPLLAGIFAFLLFPNAKMIQDAGAASILCENYIGLGSDVFQNVTSLVLSTSSLSDYYQNYSMLIRTTPNLKNIQFNFDEPDPVSKPEMWVEAHLRVMMVLDALCDYVLQDVTVDRKLITDLIAQKLEKYNSEIIPDNEAGNKELTELVIEMCINPRRFRGFQRRRIMGRKSIRYLVVKFGIIEHFIYHLTTSPKLESIELNYSETALISPQLAHMMQNSKTLKRVALRDKNFDNSSTGPAVSTREWPEKGIAFNKFSKFIYAEKSDDTKYIVDLEHRRQYATELAGNLSLCPPEMLDMASPGGLYQSNTRRNFLLNNMFNRQ